MRAFWRETDDAISRDFALLLYEKICIYFGKYNSKQKMKTPYNVMLDLQNKGYLL